MNCEQANQMDLVDYLNSLGYQPQKIRRTDHWFLSPFRNEKEASFKVERIKNVWYDHGLGKGGKLVDFVMEFYHSDVVIALQKISFFQPQITFQSLTLRQPLQSHQSGLFIDGNATETAIKIITAKQPIQILLLCRYLHDRRIDKHCLVVFL